MEIEKWGLPSKSPKVHHHHNCFRYWSPVLGQWAARISKWDKDGSEFYCIIPYDGGCVWRKEKEKTLLLIDEAIKMGLKPGEVIEE